MAGAFSEDEDIPPRVSFIPDFFVPIPRGGGRQVPSDLVRGVQGSWSLIRQPAACERGALPDSHDSQAWSLFLSLSIYIYIHTYKHMYSARAAAILGEDGMWALRERHEYSQGGLTKQKGHNKQERTHEISTT